MFFSMPIATKIFTSLIVLGEIGFDKFEKFIFGDLSY